VVSGKGGKGGRSENSINGQSPSQKIHFSMYYIHYLMIFDCGCMKACLLYSGPCVTLILSSDIDWLAYVQLVLIVRKALLKVIEDRCN
jgi:hypothetical protein